jgi:hypothetical protein
MSTIKVVPFNGMPRHVFEQFSVFVTYGDYGCKEFSKGNI